MKITKRELNNIIKEEIYETLEEVLTEDDLEKMGEVPFEGTGFVEKKPEAAPATGIKQQELLRMEQRLKNLIADTTVPEGIKQERVNTLLRAIEEYEKLGI